MRASGEYVLILSTEALLGLPGWHEPQRILGQCLVAVVPRPGYRAPGRAWFGEHFPGQEGRVVFVEGPELGHSASLIRRYAADGQPIRYLVPPAVEAYVARARPVRRLAAGGDAAMNRPVPAPGSRRPGLPARDARPADVVPLDAAAALQMARRAVDLAADKKAIDIVLLGIGELTTVADYLVICAGSSERQLGAIADGITKGWRPTASTRSAARAPPGRTGCCWTLAP